MNGLLNTFTVIRETFVPKRTPLRVSVLYRLYIKKKKKNLVSIVQVSPSQKVEEPPEVPKIFKTKSSKKKGCHQMYQKDVDVRNYKLVDPFE